MTAFTSVRPNDDVPFEVRLADSEFLVVEKPAGVVTQPGKKHQYDSLLNGLFCDYGNALQNLGEAREWGLLHRLDKDTSGLVIVALRIRAYERLLQQFKDRLVKKTYWTIVSGTPQPAQGVIQKPIAEVVGKIKRAILKRDGQQAITAYRILQSAEDVSLVEAAPKTGRLHQIRVHLASLGCPVLGDELYGGKTPRPAVPRLCLHAAALSFLHPATGHRVRVNSPWPSDLARTLKRLGLREPLVSDHAGEV
jgi:23S rRNA pseudouridine1911/1915/1917 synthase